MDKITFFILLLLVFNGYSQEPNDCVNSIITCGNSNVSLDVEGVGTQELTGSNTCSSQENNSIWLKVTVATGGTLGFTLTPNSTSINEDYDFFVFGPNVSCGNIGNAIRCSTTNPSMAGQGNNLTGMTDVADDEVSEGPGDLGDSFVEWLIVQANESYFFVIDRPIGNSPFTLEWTGTATFYESPNDESPIGVNLTYENCDLNNNSKASFDLTQDEIQVVGSQLVNVTYHQTISDAQIGVNAIVDPSNFESETATRYMRLTNSTTGCFSVFDIDLEVFTYINLPQLNDYDICEIDNNGIEQFDFSENDLLVSQLAPNYSISYHLSETGANQSINAIVYPYENTSNPQTIWMRFENLDTGCQGVSPFNIQAIATPISNPSFTDWSVCDADTDGIENEEDNDGFYIFDFTNSDFLDNLLNGQDEAMISFSYYHSFVNAEEKTLPLDVFYTNENAFEEEEIFVRMESTISDRCFTITSFTIQVNEMAVANKIEDWIYCDDNNDGFYEFNLDSLKNDILNGQDENTFTVSFYGSQIDADTGTSPLPLLYTNQNANVLETVYYRVESNLSVCYDTNSFDIHVINTPIANQINNFIICDDDNDGFIEFDFNTLFVELLNGQNQADINISFYHSLVDAEEKILPLGLLHINENPFEKEEIFVRMESKILEECYNITSFKIQVIENPVFDVVEETKYICVNLLLQTIDFEIENIQGNYSFSWKNSNGDEISTNSVLSITEAGDYTVTATTTDGNNCETTKIVHLLPAEPANSIQFTMNEYWHHDNFSVDVSIVGTGVYQFALDHIDGPYQENPLLTNIKPGIHTIYVKEMNDCGINSKIIEVFGFAPYFSPNGDGVNDIWEIKYLYFKKNAKISIFDRYGKLLFQFQPALNQGWDGIYNGQQMPKGDYWFTAEMLNQKGEQIIRKGHFSLIKD